jgi:hypothetical protein
LQLIEILLGNIGGAQLFLVHEYVRIPKSTTLAVLKSRNIKIDSP